MLAYERGVEAMEWLCKAFGFSEKTRMLDEEGTLIHGEIAIGNSLIMLATPNKDYQSPKHHRQLCALADKWYQSPYILLTAFWCT